MSAFATARRLLVTTGKETLEDDVPSLSAAIAYYTVFSLPPLLVTVVAIAGAVFGPDRVQEALLGQAGSLVGPEGAAAIEGMIADASDVGSGLGSKLVGLAALLFGATGAFMQLQKALNRAWEVEDVSDGGILATITKRLMSFGLILTIAFLLLVSLALSAVLSALGDMATQIAPTGLANVGMQILSMGVSLGVITLLFAIMFVVLPDAKVAWQTVWVGAFATALLFTLGKFGIGLYLGQANPTSAFGAAGSLALILIWVYYSALIVLVGAEFTQAWAVHVGKGVEGGSRSLGTLLPGAEPGGASPDDPATPETSAGADAARARPSGDGRAPDGFSIEDAASGRTRA